MSRHRRLGINNTPVKYNTPVSLQYLSTTSYEPVWDRVLGLEISTPFPTTIEHDITAREIKKVTMSAVDGWFVEADTRLFGRAFASLSLSLTMP
jgi:hypothetical protein